MLLLCLGKLTLPTNEGENKRCIHPARDPNVRLLCTKNDINVDGAATWVSTCTPGE